MNEKIKALAEQTGISFEQFIVDEYVYDFYNVYIDDSDVLEKFAELIIKECIRLVSPEDSYNDDWFKAKCDSVLKIKEHFGIE